MGPWWWSNGSDGPGPDANGRSLQLRLVRAEGLEPTLLSERAPKARASASFATPATRGASLLAYAQSDLPMDSGTGYSAAITSCGVGAPIARPDAYERSATGTQTRESWVTFTSLFSSVTGRVVMFLAIVIHLASMSVTSWVSSPSRSSIC